MFCVIFAGFLKIIVPRVVFLHNFFDPVVVISHFRCALGVGNSPFQKTFWKLAWGGGLEGWSGLELTDT